MMPLRGLALLNWPVFCASRNSCSAAFASPCKASTRYGASFATGALGGNQNGAAAAKRVEDQTAATRAVLERVGDHGDRLDGRMHG